MSGRVFAIEDFDSEVTAPPFHPNCGCSIVAFVEEIEEEPEEVGLSDGTVYGIAGTAVGKHAVKLSEEQKNANARYIYDYLTAQGWTTEAIAGLLGNIEKESGMNPGIWESFNNLNGGYGLVQWTKYKENYKFLAWADLDPEAANAMATNNPKELMDLQLEYLLFTMSQPGGTEQASWYPSSADRYYPVPFVDDTPRKITWEEFISSTSNPSDLAQVFHAAYEKSGDHADGIERRVQFANAWYAYLLDLIGG